MYPLLVLQFVLISVSKNQGDRLIWASIIQVNKHWLGFLSHHEILSRLKWSHFLLHFNVICSQFNVHWMHCPRPNGRHIWTFAFCNLLNLDWPLRNSATQSSSTSVLTSFCNILNLPCFLHYKWWDLPLLCKMWQV